MLIIVAPDPGAGQAVDQDLIGTPDAMSCPRQKGWHGFWVGLGRQLVPLTTTSSHEASSVFTEK
jgi:hypothetical protein